MGDVHITQTLPDGRAVGVDDKGAAYVGTPAEVGHDGLTVETRPYAGDDGHDVEQLTLGPGGQVVGRALLNERAFYDDAMARARAAGDDDPAATAEHAWQAVLELAGHREAYDARGPVTARVYDWQEL